MSTNTTTRTPKVSKEVAATKDFDEIIEQLSQFRIGWGMMCVADGNDLGRGPQMVRQAFNPRPLYHSLVKKMHNNIVAEGLANHMMVQAIQIGIKPSMIAGGLSTQPRTTAYNNYVTWSSEAKQPGAKMFLINGNHRVALIQRMYEKEIINLQQARSTCRHGQNEREKADAGKAVEKLSTKLGQQAVWLVEFYNLDEMEKAPKGSVMLLHLSANTMRPEKVDSDTEKLKNLLHLLRGKSEEEANKVYNTIAQSWVDSKEANSVRPAFIISHRELAKLFARIFAFSTLENSKLLTVSLVYENLNPYLTGLVLALFKPMLSILEFLASPWQIQDIETASTNVLGPRDPTAVLSEQDYQRLLNSMGKVACAALRDPQHAPMIPVLESFDEDCLLASWNDIFSLKLSPFMHLFGTSEPEEIITYQNQYNAYFETVISTTKALVDTILPTISEDDVTRPVLTNLICKLQWVKLGLQPTDEPVIESDTPCPLFTDLSMMTMLGNWNTTKITLCKRDAAGQDINFGPALAEVTDWLFPMCRYPMSAQRGAKRNWTCIMGAVGVFLDNRLNIKDQRKQQACVNQFISLLAGSRRIALTAVRVGVAKLTGGDWEKRHKEHFRSLFEPVGDTKWLDAFTTFMKAYRSQLTGTAPTLARAKASNNIYNAALDGCVSEERKTYFKEVYKILRYTPLPWEGQPPSTYNQTLVLAMLCEVDRLVERKKLLQIASIWDLRQSVLDLFASFGQRANSSVAWSCWDNITTQPTLATDNPVVSLMGAHYPGETLGKAVERAASAPQIESHNISVMRKIVDLISVPTLGLCEGADGKTKLDAELKIPLQSFLTSLATVSVKKTLRMREPTLDLSNGPLSSKVQELLVNLGYGINLQNLQFMELEEAKEHWRGRTAEELDPHGAQSLQSTSTVAYSEKERLEQQRNLEKLASRARKFTKKPSRLLQRNVDSSDEDMPGPSKTNIRQFLVPTHGESSGGKGHTSGSDKRTSPDDGFDTDTHQAKHARTGDTRGTDQGALSSYDPQLWAEVIKAMESNDKPPLHLHPSSLVPLLFTMHNILLSSPQELAVLTNWVKGHESYPTDLAIYNWIKSTWAGHDTVFKEVEPSLLKWAEHVLGSMYRMDSSQPTN